MFHRPVCVKCQVEMEPAKVGVVCLDMAEFGPYKMTESDLYQCPICGIQILTAFGEGSMHHNEPRFKPYLKAARANNRIIECKERPVK